MLRQFDTLCAHMGSITISTLNQVILVLDTYFYSVNALPKANCTMCNVMSNPRKLTVRHHAACLIGIYNYFTSVTGEKGK